MIGMNSDWLSRCGGDELADFSPTFTGFNRVDHQANDLRETAVLMRQAFTFFRRHSDRRYSAQSLMKVLSFADYLDAVVAGNEQFNPDRCPSIVVAMTPAAYDEDTEVKSGGMAGVGILLPDNRLMLCVHSDKRRFHVGTALIRFVSSFFNPYPEVWVHRNNHPGAQFVAATGLSPWSINPLGAVQYCQNEPAMDTDMATDCGDDVEYLLEMQRQQALRPTRRRR